MRADPDHPARLPVEFVDEAPEPVAGAPAAGVRRRDQALIVAGFLALVAVLPIVGHIHPSPILAPRPQVHVRTPSIATPTARTAPAPAAPVRLATGGLPSAAVIAAFSADIPGSVVVSERTTLADRGRRVDHRTIRAVSGNVVLDIVVTPSGGPLPSRATRARQRGYAVTVRSKGYYPPTREQLRRLATDHRLTTVV